MKSIVATTAGKSVGLIALGLFATVSSIASAQQPGPGRTLAPATDGKLNVIAFGAHPDDCELMAGGVAAQWAEHGHRIKFVSLTNGDIGHFAMAGGPLAERSRAARGGR